MVVTLSQQNYTGEKPTVMLYTYINRHAGTPDKKQKQYVVPLRYFQHAHFIPIIVGVGKRGEYYLVHGDLPSKAALVRNYLEVYLPRAGGLSAVNAIGTQLRDPINSGLTRRRMAAINE